MVRSTADGHRIGFGLAGPSPEARPRRFGWYTLAGLLLLTALAYAYVRHLLKPLEAIGEGVARFGRGDFAAPIVTAHNDELADLADRINRMAGSLQGMLDAKRALLLAISHELRSPLTRARVNAELVSEGEHRDALLRDLGEMRDLITDLLESERLVAGHTALQTERVDLAALVHEVAEASFSGRDLHFDIADGIAPVQADPTRLRLLLRNLIDNALRHSAGAAAAPTVFLTRADDGMAHARRARPRPRRHRRTVAAPGRTLLPRRQRAHAQRRRRRPGAVPVPAGGAGAWRRAAHRTRRAGACAWRCAGGRCCVTIRAQRIDKDKR